MTLKEQTSEAVASALQLAEQVGLGTELFVGNQPLTYDSLSRLPGYKLYRPFTDDPGLAQAAELVAIRNASELDVNTARFQATRKGIDIFVGPSGAGQTSVVQRLVELHPETYAVIPTATTRTPNTKRQEEQHPVQVDLYHGVQAYKTASYYHVSPADFETLKRAGFFLETKQMWDNKLEYGTPYISIDNAVSSPIPIHCLVPDFDGADAIIQYLGPTSIAYELIGVLPKIKISEYIARLLGKRSILELSSRLTDAHNDIKAIGLREPTNRQLVPPQVRTLLMNPNHASGKPVQAAEAFHAYTTWRYLQYLDQQSPLNWTA